MNDAVELILRANPMVVRLVVPEWAVSSDNLVGCIGSRPFQPVHNVAQWDFGKNDHVDMVSHNHPSGQIVKRARELDNLIADDLGDAGVSQPNWPGGRMIGLLIEQNKSFAISKNLCGGYTWFRTRQPPCNEDPSIRWKPMRQLAKVKLVHPKGKCHPQGIFLRKTCVTGFSLSCHGQAKACHTRRPR